MIGDESNRRNCDLRVEQFATQNTAERNASQNPEKECKPSHVKLTTKSGSLRKGDLINQSIQ